MYRPQVAAAAASVAPRLAVEAAEPAVLDPCVRPIVSAAHRSHRWDIDVMRVLAALLVVTCHVSTTYILAGQHAGDYGPTYWAALTANASSRWTVPVFFAIAGWAMWSRRLEDDDSAWLGRRMRRLAVPLVVWNVIFIVEAAVSTQLSQGQWPWSPTTGSVPWLIAEARNAIAGPGASFHLWFMYYLIPVTLLVWLIQIAPRLESGVRLGRMREWTTVVSVAAGIVVAYGVAYTMKVTLSWSTLGWALAYAVLGYALLTGPRPPRLVGVALFLVGTIAMVYVARVQGYSGLNSWAYANYAPFVLAATVGFIWIFRSLEVSERWRGRLRALASLTFGVYFCHMLVLDYVRLAVDGAAAGGVPGPIRFGVAWILTLTVTLALVWAWHRSRRLTALLG